MNEQILSQVEFLATAYGREKIPTDRIELYADQLDEMPLEHLEAVVKRLIRTEKFFPSVSEIYGAWTDLLLGPPKPDESLTWCLEKHRDLTREAEQAYYAQDVRTRGMFQYHPKAPSEYPDPVIAETVRLVGWPDLIEMDRDYRKGVWTKKYGEARDLVARRIQAGEVRLQLPQPENLRSLKAVGS